MPRGRPRALSLSSGALATIRSLREQIETTKQRLRDERAAAVAKIAEIDQALAELGEPIGPPPAAPTARREPKMTRAPRDSAPAAGSAAHPSQDDVVAELKELAPWREALSPASKEVFDLRIRAISCADIAKKLGKPVGSVTSALFYAKTKLRRARDAKTKPAERPANDGDESEPAPAATVEEAAARLLAARATRPAAKPRAHSQRIAWDLLGADGVGFVARDQQASNETAPPDAESLEISATTGEVDPTIDEGTPVALDEIPTLTALAPRAAPDVPAWILAWLHPQIWEAFHSVVVDDVSAETTAFSLGVSLQKTHAMVYAAKKKIAKLLAWEREREAEGNPLTDADRMPPAREVRDPLLDVLGIPQPPKERRPTEEPPGSNTTHNARMTEFRRHAPFFELLDDRCRSVALLVAQGYSTDAIATELHIKRFDVYQQIDKAIERLRKAEAERVRIDAETVTGHDSVPVDPDGEDDVPTNQRVEELRRRSAASPVTGRIRSRTIAPGRLGRQERRLSELLVYPDDVDRPATREHCSQMARPCPFVSCSHHLYLDVNPETGAIKLNFPHLQVWEMAETCSLDVADRGGISLEKVGAILNLTRERIRQVEVRGLAKIKNDEAATDALIDAESPERRGSPLGEAIEN